MVCAHALRQQRSGRHSERGHDDDDTVQHHGDFLPHWTGAGPVAVVILGWDQRTGTLPKRKPPDSAAITHEMERNYRLYLERGPTFAAPAASRSSGRCSCIARSSSVRRSTPMSK